MKYVKALEKLGVQDVPLAGHKAVALGRLLQKGFNVPGGFVVLVFAFDNFVGSAGIKDLIKTGIDGLDFTNSKKLALQSELLRQAILTASMPDSVAKKILDARRDIQARYLAVRSSATAEDSAIASAAGQMESCIGIQEAGLLDSVKTCWASLFSVKALSYCHAAGIPIETVRPAVIIQAMVASEVSGVVFTADPVGRKSNQMVIEAALGMGRATVEGIVTPDRYVINKFPAYLVSSACRKQEKFLKRAGSAMIWQEAAPGIGAGCKLESRDVMQLAQTAKKIEQLFYAPQDIEWAKVGKEIFILQSRDIVFGPEKAGARDIWSNVNISEVLPGANPPMVATTVSNIINQAFRGLFGGNAEQQFVGDFQGRLYFNATLVNENVAKIFGSRKISITSFFGGQKGGTGKPRVGFAGVFNVVFFAVRVGMYSIFRWPAYKRAAGTVKKRVLSFDQRLAAARKLPELLGLEHDIYESLKETVVLGIRTLAYPMSSYFIFKELCRCWLADSDGGKANAFVASGSDRMAMIRGFEMLWSLSRTIRNNESVREKFLKAAGPAQAERVICDYPEAAATYQSFLEQFGHRAAREVDFSMPRWKENPRPIIDTIKKYLDASEENNPASRVEKLKTKLEMLLWETSRQLASWKFFLFKRSLAAARGAMQAREEAKSNMVMFLLPMRKAGLAIGAALKDSGVLSRAEDIFFINRQELDALREGRLVPDAELKQAVLSRKKEFKANLDVIFPDAMNNDGTDAGGVAMPQAKSEVAGDIVRGLGVSPGVAQGVARIIENASQINELNPGEILVCRHADPGWTPVFVIAKGVITDTGGLLSHASIIAREYGLPMITNIKNATQAIHTGQTVLIDGSKGTVKILKSQ